jgi:hypothetical protein
VSPDSLQWAALAIGLGALGIYGRWWLRRRAWSSYPRSEDERCGVTSTQALRMKCLRVEAVKPALKNNSCFREHSQRLIKVNNYLRTTLALQSQSVAAPSELRAGGDRLGLVQMRKPDLQWVTVFDEVPFNDRSQPQNPKPSTTTQECISNSYSCVPTPVIERT